MGLWWVVGSVPADEIALNPSHPERYTVVPGDTLWGIAAKFLMDPWRWPEVWHEHRQIANPHWIYPGDVLWLTWTDDGRPQLEVAVPSELRLSPTVRSSPIEAAVPAIPISAVRQFLIRPLVMTLDELAKAPYVLSLESERVVGGAGDRIFVRSILENYGDAYTIFRPGKPYQDVDTGEILGYEGVYIGEAQLQRVGDPATLSVTRSLLEVAIGDRLVTVQPGEIVIAFHPHPPKAPVRGHIISVVGGVSQIGQYSVVAIDRGTADGIDSGTALAIWQRGALVRDFVGSDRGELVATPDQDTGVMMIFRASERVSYGLVMEAARALHLYDIVTPP